MDISGIRALLLVANEHNRRFLSDHLRRYGIEMCEDTSRIDSSYDICFVDEQVLTRFHTQILHMKQAAEPRHIPCLLVGRNTPDTKFIHRHSAIDHVLDIPLSDDELQVHLETALRARRYSIALNEKFFRATTKAKLSEERDRTVSELTFDYTYGFRCSADGSYIIEWAPPIFQHRSGYTLNEINQRGWMILMHPADIPSLRVRKQRLTAGLMDVREFRLITKFGETRWVLDRAMPVMVNGKLSRIYGAAQDITGLKIKETASPANQSKNGEIARLAPLAIYQTDVEGNVVYMNECWSQFTGLPSERAYGMGWKKTLHPDDVGLFEHWQRNLQQGKRYSTELRYRKPDGTIVWAYTWAEPQVAEDGTPAGYIGAIADITERKMMEDALRQSEYRLRRVLETIPIGVWILDAAGNIVHGNEAVKRIWGGARYIGIGHLAEYKGWWLNSGKQLAAPDWAVARAIRNGETSIDEEIEIECFDGTHKVILNSAVPLHDDQHNIIGAIGINQDIGERKRAEEKLRTHAEILDNMAEGVIVTDDAGYIFYTNAAMERIYGFASGELIGSHVSALKAAPPKQAQQLIADILATLKEHGHWIGEFDSRRKNGEVFTTAARISRITISGVPYVVSVQQDVSELKKAEELALRLAAIVQSTDDAVIGKSLDGTVVSWNPAAEAMYGYTSEEICGKLVSILIPPGRQDDFVDIMAHLSRGQGLTQLETKRMRKDGVIIDVSLTLSPIKDASGRIIGAAKIARDITEKKKAEESLRLWERAIEASSNGIMIVDVIEPTQPIVYANAAFQHITGYAPDEVKGRNARFLQGRDTDQASMEEIRLALREKREGRTILCNYRKDGKPFWNELSVAPVRNAEGHVTHFIGILNDITERRRYEAELEYQATHDALTRLPNRVLLQDRLRQAMAHAQRDGKMVAVIFVDLGRFQIINDTIGHEAGDQLLCQASQRLQSIFRTGDTVARHGGDEFVVVMEGIETEQEVINLTQQFMQAMAVPFPIADKEFYANSSIGIALYPKDGTLASELLKNANAAMYRAKELGRNNFQFYTPAMNKHAHDRLELESALRNALDRSEFVLHYQPQVDLSTGTVVGMEALIRWKHPKLGMVPPSHFIELAEETGLIVPIGSWALRTACLQAKAWQRAGIGDLRIAVNLSARQFIQHNLVSMIASVLEETGLEAKFLDIELTESLVMTDVERAIGVLNELRELGVQLSIDDFGTGYSSLSYLKRFPIDVLKIDRSFVHEISRFSNDAAISTAIISMAHSLGIRVIAEGVESEIQCEFLSHHLCDEMQGFLFSPALPANEIEAVLREARRLPQHLLRSHKPRRTLLLVDDDADVLATLQRQLEEDDYEILTATSSKEALALLAKHDIAVVISDQQMPGMSGVDFLRTVKNLYAETIRIVLSDLILMDLRSVADAINDGTIYKFLAKPWNEHQFRKHIAQAFQHKEMQDENTRLNRELKAANQGLAKTHRQLEEVLKQKQQTGRD